MGKVDERGLKLPDKVDVLIFAASYGGGHLQAARALVEGFQLIRPELRCTTVNFFRELSPTANRLLEISYRQAVLRAPLLWKGLYRLTDRSGSGSRLERRLSRLFFRRTRSLLAAYNPRLLVSTHPMVSRILGEMKRRGLVTLPLATVLTDQSLHSQWLHPCTDLYLAGSNYVRARLMRRGVPAERIAVTGIPISPSFALPRDRTATRKALGLNPDLPVVLIMVGAQGLVPDAADLCAALAALPLPLQVVFVAGHDERLRAQVQQLALGSRQPVHVLGFVTNIEEWMAASDILVGKAGGLTTAEALARGLPLVIVHPIPGQEEDNTRFLVHAGAAVRVEEIHEAAHAVEEILTSPSRLAAMRRAAARIARPQAAEQAAQAIANLLCGQAESLR
ncbi:MAG: processive 1,2-diacylglycerol beta-glucosyltransferase [Bacillota bacterium]|nr:processive 1,2-diacylglycerol beta-glucosyltransferase [Bacillota bacterium]